MTQEHKDLLLKDLCARLPYGIKTEIKYYDDAWELLAIYTNGTTYASRDIGYPIETQFEDCKPHLFPLSSMTDEDYAIYSKIWEDTGKTAYLEGCHHLISTIKAYKAANNYLLSKHYDINGLIPMGLANDATGKNIY